MKPCPLRFYIGCEGCAGWFHGRCVGILQVEAEKIDEYLCPNCDPHSALNGPSSKKLNDEDRENIRRLVKQLAVRTKRKEEVQKQPPVT